MNRVHLLLALLAVTGLAQADPGELARRLSELRTEVEGLSETLDLEREALRADLRSAELRRAELEARIRQEELRLGELRRQLDRHAEVLSSDEAAQTLLVPVLDAALTDLEAAVDAGVPYRVDDRLAAIEATRRQLRDGTLDPRKGAGRVWQLYEDELRLTRENVLDRQVVGLPEGEALVDVARLGTVALYWKASDDRAGWAVREGDGWRHVEAGPEALPAMNELFEALRKQVRVGAFELPWTLPEVSR